jgi:hypothetical protein
VIGGAAVGFAVVTDSAGDSQFISAVPGEQP